MITQNVQPAQELRLGWWIHSANVKFNKWQPNQGASLPLCAVIHSAALSGLNVDHTILQCLLCHGDSNCDHKLASVSVCKVWKEIQVLLWGTQKRPDQDHLQKCDQHPSAQLAAGDPGLLPGWVTVWPAVSVMGYIEPHHDSTGQQQLVLTTTTGATSDPRYSQLKGSE